MSDIPDSVLGSRLWRVLLPEGELTNCLERLRQVSEQLAGKIASLIPELTDHSIAHLDQLWRIADEVLTSEEMTQVTIGEAFVLGCSFYVHDLGMALAATKEGAQALRSGTTFQAEEARLIAARTPPDIAARTALKIAARTEHAKRVHSLVAEALPGLGRFLIEDSEIRQMWSTHIGNIAASHHWSLTEVEQRLGSTGRIPDAIGGTLDLAFVASMMRILDYAHMNCQRASILERSLRPTIPPESSWHWLSQECVTGPIRDGTQLVYASVKPIADVDAWWTFYEMAVGLDREIAEVNQYLARRASSSNRFSLEGVKYARNPQLFAQLVHTSQFEPLDIRFKPDSVERLIGILGGPTLYGNDHFAPIRELLQNARDAVELVREEQRVQGVPVQPGRIGVELEQQGTCWRLRVEDDGVGMSQNVIANYLLGIAADYWNSADFYSEHPTSAKRGFVPVGRFGVGFLSVFMLGDNIDVRSQRHGGSLLFLRLRGVGRRGALVRGSPTLKGGTTIDVEVGAERAIDLMEINKLVLSRAPMLTIPIDVNEGGQKSQIAPGWWRSCSQEELSHFVANQPIVSTTPKRLRSKTLAEGEMDSYYRHFGVRIVDGSEPEKVWPGKQPELLLENCRVLAVPDASYVLLCTKGFAVRTIRVPGMLGIVNIDDLPLNVARSQPIGWDANAARREWLDLLNPFLVSALDKLSDEGDVPARFKFISKVAESYGRKLLLSSSLPWITMIQPPGNALQISSQELSQRVRNASEVLITYGVSPWQARSRAKHTFPDAGRDAVILPISSAGQPDPGSYDDRNEVIKAPLGEHFGTGQYPSGDLEDATLLCAVIDVVADAWDGKVSDLRAHTWVRHSRVLYGHLKRLA